MTLFWIAVWALMCGATLALQHRYFDDEGELARYTMGTAAIQFSFSGWVLTVYGWAEPWQEVIFAGWAIAGTGGIVVYAVHRVDAIRAARRAQHEAEEARIFEAGREAGNPYPRLDQDI